MINEITIRNFKCLNDAKISLSNLTLLSGLNGMGKSSVIQSFLLLRQSHQQGLLDRTGLALNGDLIHIGSAQDALFEGALEEKISFSVKMDDGEFGEWQFNYDRKADVMSLNNKNISNEVYINSLFNDNFQYLQAERQGPRRFYEMSDYYVQQHRQLGTRGEYSIHFLHSFGKTPLPCPNVAFEKITSNELKHHVEAWLGEISPGTRIELESDSNTDLMSLRYAFEDKTFISRPYRSTNVGFGITYTLPVLVALLSARKGSLILIENPEAHLHPKGQVMMGKLIAKAARAGIQILVETHSDHILNGVRLSVYDEAIDPQQICLHFFERNSGGRSTIITPSIDHNGRIDQWPNGFFDEWDNSLAILIKPRNK